MRPLLAKVPWLWLTNAVLIGVLAMNVYRAFTQSFTIDEAFSYLSFISAPFGDMLKRYDANNHVINTLLSKLVIRIFGKSEFTLRIPSLLGGVLFLIACQRLLRLIVPEGWFLFLTYSAVVLNPIVLDYLSAARGYSLALGFQFCALWLLAAGSQRTRDDYVIGACLGLSVASNLTFIIPNALIVCGWFVLSDGKNVSVLKATSRVLAAFATVAALFLALPLRHATAANFYIGEESAAKSVETLLSRSFAFPDFQFGHSTADALIRVIPAALIVATLVVLASLVAAREPSALVPLAFLASVVSLLALHALFGLLYPHERTGLYLIPFATITLALSRPMFAEVARQRIIARTWGAVVCLLLTAMVCQYVIELKVSRYEEWTFDAGTKRVLLKLRDLRRGQTNPEHLGVSWVLEATANWYRFVYGWGWIAPVTRDDPHTNAFDSYYLTQDDFDVIKQKALKVVYTDPVSGSVLALPPAK